MEDLETACGQAIEGRAIALPPTTTAFGAWAAGRAAQARPEVLAHDIAYWERHIPGDDVRLPLDFMRDPGLNTLAGWANLSFRLDPEETRRVLQGLPRRFRTQINEPLLTALARTITAWTGRRSLVVDLEGHGRDSASDKVDLSRTVGWLTTVFPMRLDLAQTIDPVEALQAVKEQLRAVPGRGAGHGRLAYLATGVELSGRLRVAPKAQICFSYLGQADLPQERGNLLRLVSDGCRSIRNEDISGAIDKNTTGPSQLCGGGRDAVAIEARCARAGHRADEAGLGSSLGGQAQQQERHGQ